MGRLPRRIWYGLNLITSGARDVRRFLNKIDREYEGQRWTTKAVLYPYKRPKKTSNELPHQFGYRLIGDLRKQGFILKRGKGIFLTKKGREIFDKIAASVKRFLPVRNYSMQVGKDLIIVSFDIPEKERGKRASLRKSLISLGLKFYHQSLWMGYVIIPEDFLHDLTAAKIDHHIAIFTVGKRGTLRKIF